MPLSAEDFDVYVHRIGRTGRAGMSGVATSFFVPGRETGEYNYIRIINDINDNSITGEGNGKIAPQILRLLQENNQEIPEWFLNSDDLRPANNNHRNNNNRGVRQPQQQYGNNNYNNGNQKQFGWRDVRGNQEAVVYNAGGGMGYDNRQRRNDYAPQRGYGGGMNPHAEYNEYGVPAGVHHHQASYGAPPYAPPFISPYQDAAPPLMNPGYFDPYASRYPNPVINNMEAMTNRFTTMSVGVPLTDGKMNNRPLPGNAHPDFPPPMGYPTGEGMMPLPPTPVYPPPYFHPNGPGPQPVHHQGGYSPMMYPSSMMGRMNGGRGGRGAGGRHPNQNYNNYDHDANVDDQSNRYDGRYNGGGSDDGNQNA